MYYLSDTLFHTLIYDKRLKTYQTGTSLIVREILKFERVSSIKSLFFTSFKNGVKTRTDADYVTVYYAVNLRLMSENYIVYNNNLEAAKVRNFADNA